MTDQTKQAAKQQVRQVYFGLVTREIIKRLPDDLENYSASGMAGAWAMALAQGANEAVRQIVDDIDKSYQVIGAAQALLQFPDIPEPLDDVEPETKRGPCTVCGRDHSR